MLFPRITAGSSSGFCVTISTLLEITGGPETISTFVRIEGFASITLTWLEGAALTSTLLEMILAFEESEGFFSV